MGTRAWPAGNEDQSVTRDGNNGMVGDRDRGVAGDNRELGQWPDKGEGCTTGDGEQDVVLARINGSPGTERPIPGSGRTGSGRTAGFGGRGMGTVGWGPERDRWLSQDRGPGRGRDGAKDTAGAPPAAGPGRGRRSPRAPPPAPPGLCLRLRGGITSFRVTNGLRRRRPRRPPGPAARPAPPPL